MAKRSSWQYGSKPTLTDPFKATVTERCTALIETVLKPNHIKPPPDEDYPFNYIVDLFLKWWGDTLFFCATYRCPGDNCLSEFFEVKFTRMKYAGGERFHLAYMRHTGQWQEIFKNQTLDECLELIEKEMWFTP